MKTSALIFFITLFTKFSQPSGPDKITGIWINEPGDAKFEISKKEGFYEAKIVWLKNPKNSSGVDKTDKNNPDANLCSRQIVGITFVKGLRYKGDKYVNGEIYSPERGVTANCSAKLVDNNLELIITKSFFTAHQTWKKI